MTMVILQKLTIFVSGRPSHAMEADGSLDWIGTLLVLRDCPLMSGDSKPRAMAVPMMRSLAIQVDPSQVIWRRIEIAFT